MQICHELLSASRRRGPLGDADAAIRFALECRRVKPQELTAPPEALRAFFGHRCEPILPEYRAHLAWRLVRERIPCKKSEHGGVIGKQSYLGVGHGRILAPRA